MQKRCAASATAFLAIAVALFAQDPSWPESKRAMKPWIYSWWMGSSVDEAGLKAQVDAIDAAGMGGFHIVPVEAANGHGEDCRDFLTPAWMDAFRMAKKSAERYALGVDLSMGSAWCFGGPQLDVRNGTWMVQLTADRRHFKPEGDPLESHIIWEGEDRDSRPIVISVRPTGNRLSRCSPGNEGPLMDPFSTDAMERFLKPYTSALCASDAKIPDHFHHDALEYGNAGWTPEMFSVFLKKRGYDLRDYLAEFAGVGDRETVARVKCDYRETLSDMMVEDVFPIWVKWCHERSIQTKNNAYGSSANLLDFFAIADIPETFMAGYGHSPDDDSLVSRLDGRISHGDRDILVAKFASSAAHVKRAIEGGEEPVLVSAESCIMMSEGFCETLEGVKGFIDRLFLAGVNHIYYHGMCYSPEGAQWPGWSLGESFEASPANPIWHDMGALNSAVTRVQSVMQTARPDNDVLVYWPVHDLWMDSDGYEIGLSVHSAGKWFGEQSVGRIARDIYDRGYAFDFVSDSQIRLLSSLSSDTLSNASYRVVLVPAAKYMPVSTMEALAGLKRKGVKVVFAECLPKGVPGMKSVKAGEARLGDIIKAMGFTEGSAADVLESANARREPFNREAGLMFTRERTADGASVYYIVNQMKPLASGSFPVKGTRATVMNPVTGVITPVAVVDGKVELSIPMGHSILLVVDSEAETRDIVKAPRLSHPISVAGPWRMSPVCGNCVEQMAERTVDSLKGWETDENGANSPFVGTVAYETTFTLDVDPPKGMSGIMLGEVRESARVFVNGTEVGVAYLEPKELSFDSSLLKKGENALRIEVTSTGANGIKDLDTRKVQWRVSAVVGPHGRGPRRLDAAKWPQAKAGLFGPVRIAVEGLGL